MTRVLGAPPEVACRLAEGVDGVDLAAHRAVRHAVFVAEQGIFAATDHDAHDDEPGTLHVLGLVDGEPAGTVRLYPLGDGLWRGDRLAVLPAHRTSRLGALLVRFAVATAGAMGGERMVAHIQPPNERFFLRLGWTRHGDPEDYVGHPHLKMDIALVQPDVGLA